MKFSKLIILFNILTVLILLFSSKNLASDSSTMDTVSPSKVLIVYENAFDYTLAKNISNSFKTIQYDLTPISSITNINDYFLETNFTSYTDLVLIFSSDIQNMNASLFEKFSNLTDSGISITLVSSKIWQLSPEGSAFFGITPITGTQKEFNPTQTESFSLIISNITFFNTLTNYTLYQEVQSTSNLAIINAIDNDSIKVIASSTVSLSQNKTGESGIFVRQNKLANSLITSIPISLRDSNDQNSSLLLSSVINNIIVYSTSSITETTPTTVVTESSTSENSFNTQNTQSIILNEPEIAEGVILISSVAAAGYISYKVLPNVLTKKEEDIPEGSEPETWSPNLPIYYPIIAFLIAITTLFRATIYSKRYNRLNVFQVNENPVRKNIVEILEYSGYEHFNSLQKKLKIGVSILLWHLQVLEDFNIVTTEKFGQYRVAFLVDSPPDPTEVQFYCNIRSKTAFDIIKLFLEKHSWSTDTLATLLYTSNDLVKYHCKKLEKLDILSQDDYSKVFKLNRDYKEVLQSMLDKHMDISN